MIVEKIKYSKILDDYPNIDGIVPITHSTGCGMNTETEGMQIFQRTIDGFKNHPNFSHVFVIGLGCECAQISLFDKSIKKYYIDSLFITIFIFQYKVCGLFIHPLFLLIYKACI